VYTYIFLRFQPLYLRASPKPNKTAKKGGGPGRSHAHVVWSRIRRSVALRELLRRSPESLSTLFDSGVGRMLFAVCGFFLTFLLSCVLAKIVCAIERSPGEFI
jgi:hypothetical protein